MASIQITDKFLHSDNNNVPAPVPISIPQNAKPSNDIISKHSSKKLHPDPEVNYLEQLATI